MSSFRQILAGSRICKSAVSRGWNVTSISRSGEPVWSSVTSSSEPPPWSTSVSWQKADILKPKTYKSYLKNADAVVHSMGILLEADYKGVLSGKESIYSGLSRAFSSTKGGSQNPLEREDGEDLEPQEKDGQLTYELMNRDSGISARIRITRTRNGLIQMSPLSHNSRPRSVFGRRFLICFHISRSRSTHATEKIHHHQEGCRIYHCFFVPQTEKRFPPAGVSIRFVEGVHHADRFLWKRREFCKLNDRRTLVMASRSCGRKAVEGGHCRRIGRRSYRG